MKPNQQNPSKPIETVLHDHTDDWMKIPGVVGTGLGEWNQRPCIAIYVDQLSDELSSKLPSSVDGHPVRLEVLGAIDAL